ncbi:MBL fold metallo-hydrolase [Ramlibacter sp.]|uniref:MBL fold metallo-hydrolase n=1 Tax=Ramlibacter sp. TaxID=1917967 RepID=UPI003D10AC23
MNSWQVGSARVTRIEEQVGVGGFPPEKFLVGLDRATFMELLPRMPNHYSVEHDRLVSSMHSWIIRTGGKIVLVDACCGNHKDRPWMPRFHQLDTPYMQNLEAAGVKPEDVDIVLCTHLHADHVGWNTRLENGKWVPTFPNAKYLFSDRDDARWNPRRMQGMDPNRAAVYEDSVLPVVRAGQAQMLEHRSHTLGDLLTIEPSPGHTPGHVVLKLVDDKARALFCGDVLHHATQVYHPEWNSAFCEVPEEAVKTRREVLAWCADSPALLFPTHFAAPYVAAIRREGAGFALDFVAADSP